MRTINLIVIHCSGTKESCDFTERDLEASHRHRGFDGVGYHFYIRKNGNISPMRSIEKIGAHAKRYNKTSIGICYEGGLDDNGNPKDTRTPAQKHALNKLIRRLLSYYPQSRVCGHRDLSPDLNANGIIDPSEWIKQCPCYDVSKDMKTMNLNEGL